MEVTIKTAVGVSVKQLIESMSFEEAAEFCSLIGEKFDSDFRDRAYIANQLAAGLSEDGCRFIAEVVTQHYARTATERE